MKYLPFAHEVVSKLDPVHRRHPRSIVPGTQDSLSLRSPGRSFSKPENCHQTPWDAKLHSTSSLAAMAPLRLRHPPISGSYRRYPHSSSNGNQYLVAQPPTNPPHAPPSTARNGSASTPTRGSFPRVSSHRAIRTEPVWLTQVQLLGSRNGV